MVHTKAIDQFETHIHGVYAFRITGELGGDDLQLMAKTMNTAFDRMEEVDMLIAFQSDEGAKFGAGLSLEVLKSQFRSVSNVRNYCVVNAPSTAESVVEFFDNLLPIKARSFSSEHNALEYLRAQPALKNEAT